MTLVFNKVLAPILGVKADPRAAAEGLTILKQSLDVMETVWLQAGYPFLAGGRQPSIADLSLVCEIMQLQVCLTNHYIQFWVHENTVGEILPWLRTIEISTQIIVAWKTCFEIGHGLISLARL